MATVIECKVKTLHDLTRLISRVIQSSLGTHPTGHFVGNCQAHMIWGTSRENLSSGVEHAKKHKSSLLKF